MKMKKIIAAFAALMLLFAAGCNRTAVSSTETTTAGTILRPKPKNDLQKTNTDVLNIGFNSNNTETNPLKVTEISMVNLLWLSYDSMFELGKGGEMENSLVETYKVTDDGKFEFTLRSGVKFHDGTELKAQDIINSINTIKASGNDNEARNTIYANVKTMVKSATASGDNTLIMEFNEGGISPLYILCFPIVSKTGLYKIDGADDEGISFSYYENSWKRQPLIKSIKATRYKSEEEMAKAYKENTIDAVFTDHSNVGLYKYIKNTRTMNVRTNKFYYLMPNLNRGVMSNLKMRQTLSYAIDKDSIVSRAFDSNAIVSDFPIPSEFYIFDTELLTYSTDIGKCLRRFAEMGYGQVQEGVYTYLVKDGEKFTVKIIGLKEENLYHKIIAHTLSSQFNQIGIVTNVQFLSKEDYAAAIKSGNYDIAIANTEISSEFDLRYLLLSGGSGNYNGTNIAELDTALKNIAAIQSDASKIKDEYVKVQELMVKQIPMIGLCFVTDTLVYSDRLGNVGGAYSNQNMLKEIASWSFESTEIWTEEQRDD